MNKFKLLKPDKRDVKLKEESVNAEGLDDGNLTRRVPTDVSISTTGTGIPSLFQGHFQGTTGTLQTSNIPWNPNPTIGYPNTQPPLVNPNQIMLQPDSASQELIDKVVERLGIEPTTKYPVAHPLVGTKGTYDLLEVLVAMLNKSDSIKSCPECAQVGEIAQDDYLCKSCRNA